MFLLVIMVTDTLKQWVTWDLEDEFLLCEASALFLQAQKTQLDITTSSQATKYHTPQKEIPCNYKILSLRYLCCVKMGNFPSVRWHLLCWVIWWLIKWDRELLMLPLFRGPSRHHLGEQPSPTLIYCHSSRDKVFHTTSWVRDWEYSARPDASDQVWSNLECPVCNFVAIHWKGWVWWCLFEGGSSCTLQNWLSAVATAGLMSRRQGWGDVGPVDWHHSDYSQLHQSCEAVAPPENIERLLPCDALASSSMSDSRLLLGDLQDHSNESGQAHRQCQRQRKGGRWKSLFLLHPKSVALPSE